MTMRITMLFLLWLLSAAVLIVSLPGCGGQSDEDQVRETARQLAKDAHAHKWGDFCAATTNPDACTEALAKLEAVGVDAASYVPSEDTADTMKIIVDGDRAEVDATGAGNAEYVRRGSGWVFVWKDG